MLKDKNILLGVTASIAAYKAAHLTRLLVKEGARVKIIMTPASHHFITPLTLATLSKNPVHTEFSDPQGNWVNHVELGLWADLMIIAPASANTLAKMANGICDNLLLATYLSARCPVHFAPAMDLDMLKHPATQNNIQTLIKFGNVLIPPGFGELASGLTGSGRMAEPEEIIERVTENFQPRSPLRGKSVLVTAGPTYEAIDPVRFIGNHSSGKMGIALADELSKQGAEVTLVAGPVTTELGEKPYKVVNVVSNEEMYAACVEVFAKMDAAIMAAAVADYTPENVQSEKIKKSSDDLLQLTLKPTKDILGKLGSMKTDRQVLIGFALETNNEVENALGKLKKKNLDAIVLNSLNDKGAGFGTDTNKVTVFSKTGEKFSSSLKPKKEIAADIVSFIIKLF